MYDFVDSSIMTNINSNLSDIVENFTINNPVSHMWADSQFDIIKKQIQDYEKTLKSDEEIGVYLTQFGQSMLMQVHEITYEKSVTLIFKGFINDKYSVLIQHINQLNFLLTKIQKESEKPRHPIGFSVEE